MIETKRLMIKVATDEEMRLLIENETDDEMKVAYGEMLEGCINNPQARHWYAVWFIDTHQGKRIGDLCFKGVTAEGGVEIGYGLSPEYWGKGYATEAVEAMVDWASKQPEVKFVEAETEETNIASQKVLKKVGFLPTGKYGEEGPRFVWNRVAR